MRKFLYIFIYVSIYVIGSAGAQAANQVFLAPSATAGNDGLTCGTAKAISYANLGGSYSGSPSGILIGPGTTVHFCNGTYTGALSGTILTPQGNGASGNPIIFLFDSGAVFQSPACSFSGCINLSGRSFITIDGGTNGVLQNTANGTNLANHLASALIVGAPCTSCTVKNLILANTYVQVAFEGQGTNLNLSPSGSDQSSVNAIQIGGSGWLITHNTINDCGWCLRQFYGNGDANNEISFNNIFHFDHGWAPAAGAANAGSNFSFHDNQVHDAANWDCGFTGANGNCHHDGIHSFGSVSGASLNGFLVYNNYFYGAWGQSPTGFVFVEGGSAAVNMSNSAWFNNVFVVPTGSVVNTNGWMDLFSGVSGSQQFYNNTFIGPNATDNTACIKLGSISNPFYKNNVLSPCGWGMDMGTLSAFDGSNVNFNLYGPVCQNGANCFVWNGGFTGSFAAWITTCTGNSHFCDTPNSAQNNNTLLDATGVPQTGSPAINTGTNLTALCVGNLVPLCSGTSLGGTITPAARPASGNWDKGAYVSGSPIIVKPNPPTGVVATPN